MGAQGYLRHISNGMIQLKPWKDFKEYLKFINILFIDENESIVILGKKRSLSVTAKILTSYGPSEVIITMGKKGSIIYSQKDDKIYKIPAFKPKRVEDPTGLGDTYMAAYAARKLDTDDPYNCGLFASAAAALKIENKGAFKKDKESIEKRIKKNNPFYQVINGRITKGKSPATKKRTIPPIVKSLFLSIIPLAIRITPNNPIINGIT